MLTKNEITALNLSPTKKDFVQIWNELLEVAGKLSERWDPTSTNESDPGIVLLKALTGIADKLNYNIDKNTLEAFMPTAAQEDSMRKLCDMLGYNVKYYRSAETTVKIKYHNPNSDEDTEETTIMKSHGSLKIPKFTVITNGDQDINYFTTNPLDIYISESAPLADSIPCMEGQIIKCESTADNNVITATQISDNNRFYMPEYQIAENGIFVYNVAFNMTDGTKWEKVDNLNTQARGSRVFKFGYDSYEGRPYLEFPEDYSELINDGLFIYYARTSGASGNISAGTLTRLELPNTENWDKVSVENFSVENTFAATTGANIETIGQAYNSFKKTIGTFETLVTCRDYMNKIYTMVNDSTGRPFVSNILATDIRTDLNRAVTICSCDGAGIFYKDTPLTTVNTTITEEKVPSNAIGGADIITRVIEKEITTAIDHFDLVLYPFKSYNQIKNNVKDIQAVYDSSFKYDDKNLDYITNNLTRYKTVAHNFKSPSIGDITSINNYLRLNAIVGTNSKISTEEGTLLIENIKIALANAFNMRELDFGEEIPFESIVEVIEKADSRIKVVSLAEPALYTTFSVLSGYTGSTSTPVVQEYAVASDWLTVAKADATGRFEYVGPNSTYIKTFDTIEAKKIYNKLALRNVLAGRVPLFKYNTTFKASFSEGAYRTTKNTLTVPSGLEIPNKDRPFTIFTENNKTYTGQWTALSTKPETLPDNMVPTSTTPNITYQDDVAKVFYQGVWQEQDQSPSYSMVTYTETSIPDNYITNTVTKTTVNKDTPISKITTKCTILSDNDSVGDISDVTLSAGEVIKFRAPNFTTRKTYPAYVNYHLDLNDNLLATATPATAYTLAELLNTSSKADTRREEVLTYFNNNNYKKTFTLSQKVYKKIGEEDIKKDVEFTIENAPGSTEKNPSEILATSGFVKLASLDATLTNLDQVDADISSTNIDLLRDTLRLDWTDSYFITSSDTFNNIKNSIDAKIVRLDSTTPNILPTEHDWSISYTFEYVPFDSSTLSMWQKFVTNSDYFITKDFAPKTESNTVLWRAFSSGYPVGKYILSDQAGNQAGAKLMPFTSNHFGLLESLPSRLHGVYVATALGSDQKPNSISNNEEYMLRENEYLYIEYTPSTTSEASSASEPKIETFGPGTIIRPNGFESGLIDSSVYAQDHSATKNVNFKGTANTSDEIPVYSLGASEQIEIRDFSQVILNRGTLPNVSTLYVYKNFNNCDELEKLDNSTSFVDGNRVGSTYTLKDGEYIFYTDQNKTELAYFSSGTEVTLTGNTVLPTFEIIDLAAIFDSGIESIPWAPLSLSSSNADGMIFQEFQYITLSAGDTLNKLVVAGSCLDEHWKACDEVAYTLAGFATPSHLNKVNVSGDFNQGNGWQACSTLDLNVSPSSAQTLRKTDKVETSVILQDDNGRELLTLRAEDADHPLSFKTNLACSVTNNSVKITDLYNNPDNTKSFEVKVFAEEIPSILKTAKGSLVPYQDTAIKDRTKVDITNWSSDQSISISDFGSFWLPITLFDFASSDEKPYDSAVRLSVSTIPNTYGIFSIYINYRNAKAEERQTWIELLPGVAKENVSLFNANTTWQNNGVTEVLSLNPGLNCLKITKTTEIFIKTKATEGELYFDNIRLVDCQPIEYIENGEKKYQATQGLNLSQIGYLDTTEESTLNVFDQRIRKKLKTEYTNKALTELDTRAQLETSYFDKTWAEILKSKTDLQNMADFIHVAKEELEALVQRGDDDVLWNVNLDSLFTMYIDIYNDLKAEKTLKDELDRNNNIDVLEQQLIGLLEKFTDPTISKQELLNNLETLDQVAYEKTSIFTARGLSKGDILDDFEKSAKSNDTLLINDIKLASLKEINLEYLANLATVASEIDGITNAEARTILETNLEHLKLSKHAELVTSIQALLTINNSTLNDLLTDLSTSASGTLNPESNQYEVDYAHLRVLLMSLREQLNSLDIAEMLSQIKQVFESDMNNIAKYEDLLTLVDGLIQLVDRDANIDTEIPNYAALVSTVDSLITAVQGKISANSISQDSVIASDINGLSNSISQGYINELSDQLEHLKDILEDLKSEYSANIEGLTEAEQATISTILSSLSEYNNIQVMKVNAVNSFGTKEGFNIKTAYLALPYGVSAVLTVWPTHMKRAFLTGLSKLYRDTYKIIINPTTVSSLVIDSDFYNTEATPSLRPILVSAVNLAAFQQLFDQAQKQVVQNTQRAEYQTRINELGSLIKPSAALSNAIDTLKADADNRTVTIRQILTQLTATPAPTLAMKQQLIAELKKELESIIELDNALVEITANLLCPSILLYKDRAPEEFYSRINKFISDSNTALLSCPGGFNSVLTSLADEFSSASVTIESLLIAIKTDDVAKFTRWADIEIVDSEASSSSATLLAKTYLDKLLSLKENYDILDCIAKIKECRLFKLLQQEDLITAWQDSTENWMDSTGNYYRKYTNYHNPEKDLEWVAYPVNGTVTAKQAWLDDDTGTWTTANGMWVTYEGKMTKVTVKRDYTNAWVIPTPMEDTIKIKNDTAWIIDNSVEVDLAAASGPNITLLSVTDTALAKVLQDLYESVEELGQFTVMSEAFKTAHNILILEEQLLSDIQAIDTNRDFYYNVPIESNFAIDFNESDANLNTLMNPAVNYDINNVNNNFVISKIDINYLTKGIQIARSSRLSY